MRACLTNELVPTIWLRICAEYSIRPKRNLLFSLQAVARHWFSMCRQLWHLNFRLYQLLSARVRVQRFKYTHRIFADLIIKPEIEQMRCRVVAQLGERGNDGRHRFYKWHHHLVIFPVPLGY